MVLETLRSRACEHEKAAELVLEVLSHGLAGRRQRRSLGLESGISVARERRGVVGLVLAVWQVLRLSVCLSVCWTDGWLSDVWVVVSLHVCVANCLAVWIEV